MIILSVDPGYEQSAYVVYNGQIVLTYGVVPNDKMLECCRANNFCADALVLEKVASYGMAVGQEVFRTVFFSGRFAEAWSPKPFHEIERRIVKTHLCYSARATDANIRQALIDKFGPTKAVAIGTKANMGPLYGLRSHEFAALAVAVTFWETQVVTGRDQTVVTAPGNTSTGSTSEF